METAIYGRVSTEEQALEGFSIRGQVEKLQSYVSAKSWSIYDVYLDEGISGKNLTARPAVSRMIEDIKAGRVQNVLIYKLDRLTRSVADLVFLIDLFKEYGCAFNSLSESIDTSTASGRMFIKIIGIFAEFERENIAERVRMGKERKAKEGYTNACATVSYGYQRKKGENIQTIEPKEAAVVRRVFDLYVQENISLGGIAKILNADKIPGKKGGVWNSGSVLYLLRNCNYIGSVRYAMDNSERYFEVEGKHKAIVGEDLFREAQILLDKNKKINHTKRPVEKNYFAGLLYCGVCGSKIKSTTVMSKGNKTHQFICHNRSTGVCTAKGISAIKFEKATIAYFSTLSDSLPDKQEAEQAKAATALQVAALKEKLTVLDAKEKEMLDSYIGDSATLAEYRNVKTKLHSEKAIILGEIETLTSSQGHCEIATQEDIIATFNEKWNGFSNIEKRQFLLKHVKKIVIMNHPIKGSRESRCEITDLVFQS